jgi:hypothetical protein
MTEAIGQAPDEATKKARVGRSGLKFLTDAKRSLATGLIRMPSYGPLLERFGEAGGAEVGADGVFEKFDDLGGPGAATVLGL